jgi:hypothetical protein
VEQSGEPLTERSEGVVVRERATIYVRVDGARWRLCDEEGVTQGMFTSLEAAMTAARFLARDHAPSVVKGQDGNGEWRVFETFEDAGEAGARSGEKKVAAGSGRRRRKWFG